MSTFRKFLYSNSSGFIKQIYHNEWDDLLLKYNIKRPGKPIGKLWTAEEKQFIFDNYTKYTKEELAKHLSRSLSSIQIFLSKSKLLKSNSHSLEQEQFIKDNFSKLTTTKLLEGVNRFEPHYSRKSLRMKCYTWGLRKQPKAEVIWTNEMVDFLISLRTTFSDYYLIAEKINKKFPMSEVTSIQCSRKCAKINRKDKLKNRVSSINIQRGYNLTFEQCINLVNDLGITTTEQLIKKKQGLYSYMRKNKWSLPSQRKWQNLTLEQCINYLTNDGIKSKSELCKKNSGLYEHMRKNKWLNSIQFNK